MQVGSDGRTACATCHWHAGADIRTINTLNPGAPGSAFGHQTAAGPQLSAGSVAGFRGPNHQKTTSDYPFHRFHDPTVPGDRPGEDHHNLRQVTGRNAPTSINAVFFDRSFWDGRANHYFNGVNPFGDLDPAARVLKVTASGDFEPVRIRLNNAALASQAVGPPNSDVEMSWNGRTFAELGRKMLSLRPLAQQFVAADDSVLGPLSWTAPCWGRCSGFEHRCGRAFILETHVFLVIHGEKYDRIFTADSANKTDESKPL